MYQAFDEVYKMAILLAKYQNLPDAKKLIGYVFRRMSETIMANFRKTSRRPWFTESGKLDENIRR